MKKNSKSEWLQGYACAVATYIKMEGGIDVRAKELMEAGGLEHQLCKECEVDPYDMKSLFPIKTREQIDAVLGTELCACGKCSRCEYKRLNSTTQI